MSMVFKSQILPIIVAACLAAGCEGMTPTQRGAVTGGALGTGIGMVAGGSFGQVVGAGLIGGAAGAIVGSATSNR
jgi:hypothetical protein